MNREADDLATLSSLGVLAALAAALGHEALGHGGTCMLMGGEVTLLTVIWFRCAGGGVLTDVGGPIGGLLVGLVGLGMAAWAPRLAIRARLAGLLLGSFALLWFSAQLVVNGLSATGDWGGAALQAAWPTVWRPVAVLAGVIGYAALMRIAWLLARSIDPGVQPRRRFLVPYMAGALAVIACAALRTGDGSALEAARAVGLAPLGYLFVHARTWQAPRSAGPVASSWPWIMGATAALAIYAAIFGPGLGRLA
ncbi:MAG TPA: hypothetical protein VF699_03935 [Caulobacteraceae bacterium]|jgi:hypothetical protein